VAGGGRYDGMIKKFGGQDTPAVGISLGFERIVSEMERKKMFALKSKKVFVAGVSDKVEKDVLRIASELRSSGIICEVDLAGRNLRKQLDYVSKQGIDFCIIVGPVELNQKKVVLRDMKSGKEKKVGLDNLSGIFI
jgi:histidyl-tRNA synthetase